MRVKELDRILDRDYVLASRTVDQIDHRRECCRFTGTGRTGNKDQTARFSAQFRDHVRQPELFERFDLVGNCAENAADSFLLIEDVDAETREPLQADREIELAILFESFLLPVG